MMTTGLVSLAMARYIMYVESAIGWGEQSRVYR